MEALTSANEDAQTTVQPTPAQPPQQDGGRVPSHLQVGTAEQDEPVEAVEAEVVDDPEPLSLPVHSTRGEAPGARGCWAISRRAGGAPCGAAPIRGTDFCAAHTGLGIAADPAAYQPLAIEQRRENLRVQAQVRAVLGVTRTDSPRALLKAKVYAQRERIVDTAIEGALKDGRLAMRVIDAVDPPIQATFTGDVELSEESVARMPLSELMTLASSLGIQTPPALTPS